MSNKSYYYYQFNRGTSYPLTNKDYLNSKSLISNENKNLYQNKDNLIKSQFSVPYQSTNKSIDCIQKTQYYGKNKHKAFGGDYEYNDFQIQNPSAYSKSFINENLNKKTQYTIDFKNYDLKNFNKYSGHKLYIIAKNAFITYNSKKTQIQQNTFRFIKSSKEAEELLQNNLNFLLVDNKFLTSKNMNIEGNYVFLYEIGQKAYIFFPLEGNIIEIPKKNDISSDVKKNKEDEKLNIINNTNKNNENIINQDSSSQPMEIDDQILPNEKDEKTATLKTLILLYGFQKYFIELMNSPIKDEYEFKEYYLINRDWIEYYKQIFNFKSISEILDKKKNKYSYNGFSKNIEKIIKEKEFKNIHFQNQNSSILNNNNDFSPQVNKNQDLNYLTNFEVIPSDLFNLLFKIANKGNLRKDDYRYHVLIGDNVLFIQNKTLNNIFYAYTFNKVSCLEIFCSLKYYDEENFYKDVRKYIKEKGFINFLMEREIEMANYNKPFKVKDKEERLLCEFTNLSNISPSGFEAMEIKFSLKRNKKLLLHYNNFIKNCSLLKDNKKDISNINDVINYKASKDLVLLPIIIVLKNNLDILKRILYFNEIEHLYQFKNEKYEQEEEKIIKYLINQKNKIKVKDFVEKEMIFINSKTIDIDKTVKKLSFSILNEDFLLMLNNSSSFQDKINDLDECFLFNNNNTFFILYSKKNKLYKLDFIEEFDFTLREADFNREFKNTLKNIKQMIEYEELIQNQIKSNLNNLSNPEEFYLINSKWMESYKNFYNYKTIISNKNKNDNYLFNYISNKQKFPDDLKNENNLYPEIDRNIPNLKIPINFEIINYFFSKKNI